jgi:leader peptidase (prepilin peptidase)/N-methyltransferase
MVETVIIILIGMAWGSFLNVVIYRIPRDMSLVRPRSSCPHCKQKIKFYENIPIVSYIMLGGRCRHCKTRIPFSYFLVEVLTPASFILVYNYTNLSLHFFAACLFASAMIALGFIDFYHQILPDEITLPGLLLALVYSSFRDDLSLRQALMGALIGAGFILLVYGAYYLLRRKEGIGMGDVTMMLLIGAFLGWQLTFFTLVLASFLGVLVGVYFILAKRKSLQYALPFGTFLAPAAFVSLLWGGRIINWYLGIFQGF